VPLAWSHSSTSTRYGTAPATGAAHAVVGPHLSRPLRIAEPLSARAVSTASWASGIAVWRMLCWPVAEVVARKNVVSAVVTTVINAIDTSTFAAVKAAIDNLHEENPGSIGDETGEDAVFDNHLADTATVTYDRELDYTLEENSEHVLADIEAALKRIDDGTYGICTSRGEQIPVERLEALPWATLCIDCQRDRERR